MDLKEIGPPEGCQAVQGGKKIQEERRVIMSVVEVYFQTKLCFRTQCRYNSHIGQTKVLSLCLLNIETPVRAGYCADNGEQFLDPVCIAFTQRPPDLEPQPYQPRATGWFGPWFEG